MEILVFSHSADLDGKASAAIALAMLRNQGAEYCPIDYGQPFPWERIGPETEVYMLDFCLQPFSDMKKLLKECGHLVWIDHHKTAMEAYAKEKDKNPGFNIEGLRDRAHAACALTWEWFVMGGLDTLPPAIHLLSRYDVWDLEDPAVLWFQYGMRARYHEPDSPLWEELMEPDCPAPASIIQDGKAVLNYIKQDFKHRCDVLCFDTTATISGKNYNLIAANFGPGSSQFFDSVWDPEKHDIMCLFYWKPSARKWIVSLYTDKEEIDVGKLATYMGGGGHKKAAGFQCFSLPFPWRKE